MGTLSIEFGVRPMHRWGLQAMNGEEMWPPRGEAEQPNNEFLATRYERFRAA